MAKKIKSPEVKQLILLGREKGFLTFDEINEGLPDDNLTSESMDDILTLFAQMKIDVINNEANGSRLEKYLTIFLNNTQIANNHDDKRILLYRGQSNSEYSLMPSVFRNGLLEKEHLLIQDLLLSMPNEFNSNSIECLIKMQHYGLPTRLLDVTKNPLVALYFACNTSMDKDGEIIVFYDYVQHPSFLDARCLIALAEYNGSSERQMLAFLTDKSLTNSELGRLSKLTHIPIDVPLNNERIKRQQGAFIIVGVGGHSEGNAYQKAAFDLRPLVVQDFDDRIPRSMIIPKNEKTQLLKELETFGINKSFLFPELEHQASYIRSKYEEA